MPASYPGAADPARPLGRRPNPLDEGASKPVRSHVHDLSVLRHGQPGGREVLQRVRVAPREHVPELRDGQWTGRQVLQRVRRALGGRRRDCRPPRRGPGHTEPVVDRLDRAASGHGPVRRPRRLHDARRGSRPGGRPRAPDAATSSSRARSSAGTAARSRSSSATRSWPSGARRSPTRTTRSAPCAPRSTSSTPSALGLGPTGRSRRGPACSPARRR